MGKYVEKTGAYATPGELGTGTADNTTFLRGDGQWATPPGGGGGPHASSHQNGGADEINVEGLSGVLAEPQHPIIGSEVDEAVAGNDFRLTNARTPTAHSHPQSEVTNLVSDLAGKAASSHSHAQSDVTNLVSDLAGKAPTSHTHAQSDVTGLVSALAGKEPSLGNPGTDGHLLTSTAAGVRSWVAPSGGGGSTTYLQSSFTVTTGNWRDHVKRLQMTGSNRAILQGTGRFSLRN